MEQHIAKLYEDAPRFDEGELFQGEAYRNIIRQQEHLQDLLAAAFGEGVLALLGDYTDMLYEEMELEAQHFFQAGYQAAIANGGK